MCVVDTHVLKQVFMAIVCLLLLFRSGGVCEGNGDLVEITELPSPRQHVLLFEIEYKSDDLQIPGYLLVPTSNSASGGYPCVIYNRGGNNLESRDRDGNVISEDFGDLRVGQQISVQLAPLAAEGYVVVASQYRGHGPDSNWDCDKFDQFGGDDVNDVLSLIPLLRKLDGDSHPITIPDGLSAKVKSDDIAMYGWSRGGMMTYLALRRLNESGREMPITTAIIGAGPTDLFASEQHRPFLREGRNKPLISKEYDDDRYAALHKRSAVFWANKLPTNVSLLLLHGTADPSVDISQARRMRQQLQRHGVPHQAVFVENLFHNFAYLPFDPENTFKSPRGGSRMDLNLRHDLVSHWLNKHFD